MSIFSSPVISVQLEATSVISKVVECAQLRRLTGARKPGRGWQWLMERRRNIWSKKRRAWSTERGGGVVCPTASIDAVWLLFIVNYAHMRQLTCRVRRKISNIWVYFPSYLQKTAIEQIRNNGDILSSVACEMSSNDCLTDWKHLRIFRGRDQFANQTCDRFTVQLAHLHINAPYITAPAVMSR